MAATLVSSCPCLSHGCPVQVSSHDESVFGARTIPHRHPRACPEGPRLVYAAAKAWMRGTSPRMTMKGSLTGTFLNLFCSTGQPWDTPGHPRVFSLRQT